MYTVRRELMKLSKLNIGELPFLRSTWLIPLNFALLENNSNPVIVYMKITMNINRANGEIFIKVCLKVSSSKLKESQNFAILKNLRNLVPLITVMIMLFTNYSSVRNIFTRTTSIRLTPTIARSY